MSDAMQGEMHHSQNGSADTANRPKTGALKTGQDYYGIPPVKHAHWGWEVYLYFWLGGIGAGAHVVSTIARLLGYKDPAFLRASRYTILAAMLISPVLLIKDLGRPERFYNMMRVFKVRSPMSMGTWALTLFGTLSGMVATSQAAQDGLFGRQNVLARLAGALPARLLSVVALPFGFFVGAYTGVLLAATSVPMWARNAVLMGPMFLASALSTGTSAISFILHLGGWGERRTLQALRRVERVALLAEAALLAASLIRMGKLGKPLRSKELGPVFFGGTVLGGVLAPLALLSGRESRSRSLLAALLVLVGGLLFRYSMVRGGRISADDPEATFTFARQDDPAQEDGNRPAANTNGRR